MSADYTIAGVSAFQGYPFPFVRVDLRPDWGICAVQGYSTEGGVLLIPNVIPRDVDAYEVSTLEPQPFWIDAGLVYGVRWNGKE